MKLRYKVLCIIILSVSIMSSCSEKNTEASDNPQISQNSQVSSVSEISEAAESSYNAESSESQDSHEEFSEDVPNVSSEEAPEITESSPEEEISENEITLTEESSESAYFFDDEQPVEDYHTAQTFTDDEVFNELFKDNSIDKECSDKMKDAVTDTDMRMVIGECVDKWKEQSQTAYEKLKELLSDKPSELERLENSQKNWESELEDKKQEWYAPENFTKSGTMGILSADTAMMNYYKGRAAVLYQQIFVLTGNMEDI